MSYGRSSVPASPVPYLVPAGGFGSMPLFAVPSRSPSCIISLVCSFSLSLILFFLFFRCFNLSRFRFELPQGFLRQWPLWCSIALEEKTLIIPPTRRESGGESYPKLELFLCPISFWLLIFCWFYSSLFDFYLKFSMFYTWFPLRITVGECRGDNLLLITWVCLRMGYFRRLWLSTHYSTSVWHIFSWQELLLYFSGVHTLLKSL